MSVVGSIGSRIKPVVQVYVCECLRMYTRSLNRSVSSGQRKRAREREREAAEGELTRRSR